MINSISNSASLISQMSSQGGKQKIEPNPSPAPQSDKIQASGNGIIDVGDLPDGVHDIDKASPLQIIDVGDLPDGVQANQQSRIDVRV